MIKTTRAQREALFRVFQRSFHGWITPTMRISRPEIYRPHYLRLMTQKDAREFASENPNVVVKVPSIQYRRFRKTVIPYFGDTCIMVPYAGMWLGIEQDGHTHS